MLIKIFCSKKKFQVEAEEKKRHQLEIEKLKEDKRKEFEDKKNKVSIL